MSPPLSWRARVRENIESKDLMFFMPIGPTSDREASGTTMPERDDYVMFYTVYGECFSGWSGVEFNLLAIYIFLMNSSDYDAASAAFYSTNGFRAKLDMVNAVVINSKRVNSDDLKMWKKTFEECSKKSRRRNELAHNAVFFGRLSESDQRKIFVADPRSPARGSRLHLHDLVKIRESFVVLREEMLSFWQHLLSNEA